MDLIRLAELTGKQEYRRKAEATLKAFGGEIERDPASHTLLLTDLDLLVNGMREVVITAPTTKDASAMKAEVFGRFVPDKVVAVATDATYSDLSNLSALLEGRRPGRKPRAYVCQNFACKLPADSTEALREQLASR